LILLGLMIKHILLIDERRKYRDGYY
jgi:hypothetical protein